MEWRLGVAVTYIEYSALREKSLVEKDSAHNMQFKIVLPLFQVWEFVGKPNKIDFSILSCWLILLFLKMWVFAKVLF